jgi:hypothetical protein
MFSYFLLFLTKGFIEEFTSVSSLIFVLIAAFIEELTSVTSLIFVLIAAFIEEFNFVFFFNNSQQQSLFILSCRHFRLNTL